MDGYFKEGATMDPVEWMELSDFIRQRLGLDYSRRLPALAHRLKPRLHQLHCTAAQYLTKLHDDADEWTTLIALVTVHGSAFFREPAYLTILRDVMIPHLVAVGSDSASPIRIWSAGCSTGEEPYSIAITLANAGYLTSTSSPIEIVATDIDDGALSAARSGWYKMDTATTNDIPDDILQTYFDNQAGGWRIKERIQEHVVFRHSNLVDAEDVERLGKFHVIFCKHVMVYFDEYYRERTSRLLYHALEPGGYLVIGHDESLECPPGLFEEINWNGHKYYRKVAQSRAPLDAFC